MTQPCGKYFYGAKERSSRERVLFVEGVDDAYFFDTILSDIDANPEKVGIVYLGGKDKLEKELPLFYKTSAFITATIESYAIVRDADNNAGIEMEKVYRILRKHDEPTPKPGTFASISGGVRKVGLLILPVDAHTGDLEEVCLRTVSEQTLTTRTEAFVNETNTQGTLDYISKRKVQTYLANKQGELCRGCGRGFNIGHFDKTHNSLDPIKDFCRSFIN